MQHFKRTDRVRDEIKRVLGELIEKEVRDPRVGFVTVMDVDVSGDFSIAKVYVTVGEHEDMDDVLAGLRAASGFLRRRVGELVRLRVTPELHFVYDSSVDKGFQMDALLKRIAEERENNE